MDSASRSHRSLFKSRSKSDSIEPAASALPADLELDTLEPRMLFSGTAVDVPDDTSEAPAADVSDSGEESSTTKESSTSNPTETLGDGTSSEIPADGETGISEEQSVTLLGVGDGATALNQEILDAIADAAADRWRATGLTDEQSAALDSISYSIEDLEGVQLGVTQGNQISVDVDGAGNQWFIDATPLQDEEFVLADGSASPLLAGDGTGAADRYDLLTVIMHEQGHVLGVSHDPGNTGEIMDGELSLGNRRLPADDLALGALPFIAGAEDDNPQSHALAGSGRTLSAGGSQSINIRQSFTTVNYAIALTGTYPSRNLTAEDPDSSLNLAEGSDPFIGSIMQFAGNFAPRGWALADGQLLQISSNSALFSLLGTAFGGDGRTTFGLPDLRGRVPVGVGSGAGLTSVSWGERIGGETVSLNTNNLPSHDHTLTGGGTTSSAGGGQEFNNRMPGLGLYPVIATSGLFPSRNAESSLGAVEWFAGNFAPRGYMLAQGQLLPINQYQALHSILGTTYGGDGRTTFALPDLRGRTPIHYGNGIALGQKGGTETNTIATVPDHDHAIDDGDAGTTLKTGSTGTSTTINLQQPYLALNYQIATLGLYPSRSLGVEDQLIDTGTPENVLGLVSGDELIGIEAANAMIQSLAEEGINRWIEAGISAEQVAQLRSTIYEIANLDSGILASVSDHNVVSIDAGASNSGWFIDSTPADDEEFLSTDPTTGELLATDDDANTHFDLLTTIMHEQGHLLGLSHALVRGSVMSGVLGVGGRINPVAADIVMSDSPEPETSYVLSGQDFIAQIGMFAGDFAVRGYSETNGQDLPISSNTALFSLISTTYGGDGRTTTGLPDLRGRAVVHAGRGPGLPTFRLGQSGGSDSIVLTVPQMARHTHGIPEILVEHDTIEIVDGDTTPSGFAMEGTDFGSVDTATGMVSRTFTVTNTGQANLIVQPVSITGAGNSHFSVTSDFTANQVIAAGNSSTFTVEFNPTADGVFAAEIEIVNNDGDGTENPYNFAITGTGVTVSPTDNSATVTGTSLTVNADGNSDTVTISSDGTNLKISTPDDSIVGGAGTTPGIGGDILVPVAGLTNITINAGDSDDTINISSLDGFTGTLDIRGGDGKDNINFYADVVLADDNDAKLEAEEVDLVGASITTSGTGSIDIDGTGSGSGSFQGISLSGTTLSATGAGGTISLTGQGGDSGGNSQGLRIATSTISTFDGDITLVGTGEGAGAIGAGVYLVSGAAINAGGTGILRITGSASGTGTSFNDGVVFTSGSNASVHDGDMIIVGTGAGSMLSSRGVSLNSTLTGTGTGNISVTGATTGAGANNVGILGSGAVITTATGSGSITLNGTGSSNGTSSNAGIKLSNGSVTAGGAGAVSLTGLGGGNGSSVFNQGISLLNVPINATSGNITINGTGGSGTSFNEGVKIQSSTISSTTGKTDILGSANAGNTGLGNAGVYIYLNSTINGNASSTITGTGGGGTSSNHGILMNIGITSNVPLANIVGTAGSGASLDESGNFF